MPFLLLCSFGSFIIAVQGNLCDGVVNPPLRRSGKEHRPALHAFLHIGGRRRRRTQHRTATLPATGRRIVIGWILDQPGFPGAQIIPSRSRFVGVQNIQQLHLQSRGNVSRGGDILIDIPNIEVVRKYDGNRVSAVQPARQFPRWFDGVKRMLDHY